MTTADQYRAVDLELQAGDVGIGAAANSATAWASQWVYAVFPLWICSLALAFESLLGGVALFFATVVIAGLIVVLRSDATSRREHAAAFRGQLMIRDDGLRFEGDGRSTVFRWAGISKIDRTSRLITLFSGDRLVLIIPFRCFGSPEHREEFERLLDDTWRRQKSVGS